MLFTIKGTTPEDLEVFDQDGNKIQHIDELIIHVRKGNPYIMIEMSFKLPKVKFNLTKVGATSESKVDPYDAASLPEPEDWTQRL